MPDKPAPSRLAVGLMSGTSMDGIDAALVRISGPSEKPRVRLMSFVTESYSPEVRRRIASLAESSQGSVAPASQANFLLGELHAEAALKACRRASISPKRVSVIGSHGQTIYHQGTPTLEAGRDIASTMQIAEPAVIAQRTGVLVIADFRTADVAAGGQGAPLVPMVDYLLLRDKREGRVALNLGGIANVTAIPADAKPGEVFGFDTGPGNMLIDGLVRRFSGGRKHFDGGGRRAARGKVLEPVLAKALEFPFFNQEPPKSAGREQFGARFVEEYFLGSKGASFEDLVRTGTELTAKSVASALERFVFPKAEMHRLIVSGGGAHNKFLMKRLRQLLPQLKVEHSDRYGLPVDAKEAMAFALLADRTMHRLPGNLPSVTGARRAVVLGKIVNPLPLCEGPSPWPSIRR